MTATDIGDGLRAWVGDTVDYCAMCERPLAVIHSDGTIDLARRAAITYIAQLPPGVQAVAGEDAIHKWLNAQYPKTGVCEECGQRAKRTHYAYKHHPKPYTRNRDDYRELCTPCHKRFDGHTAEGGFHNAGWDKRRRNG